MASTFDTLGAPPYHPAVEAPEEQSMVQTETRVRRLTYVKAVNEALRQEMERDPMVFVMGEDVAGAAGRADQGLEDAWGGVFRLTKGLVGQFGPERVRDTPISEAGFIGAGVGAAATGMRPVVDLMFVGFLGVCADQIFNNAAKMHYMFGGKVTLPLTIMTAIGAGTNSAAQHSETVYSVFAHYPGLKCVVPSSPYTAKGLYASAIRDDDPVVIFNNMLLMGRGITEGILPGEGHVPEEPYTVPIGRADVALEGTDVTLGRHRGHHQDLPRRRQGPSSGRVQPGGRRSPVRVPDGRGDTLGVGQEDQEDRDRRRGLPALQRRGRHLGARGRAGLRLPRCPARPCDRPSRVRTVQP